jgi:hypothetical protein
MAVPIWIALSSSVILYNKYLYSNLNFPYVSPHLLLGPSSCRILMPSLCL